MPVGSMPYFTRSGLPVSADFLSLARKSASGTIFSTPRWRISSCSLNDFIVVANLQPLPRSLVGIAILGGLEISGKPAHAIAFL